MTIWKKVISKKKADTKMKALKVLLRKGTKNLKSRQVISSLLDKRQSFLDLSNRLIRMLTWNWRLNHMKMRMSLKKFKALLRNQTLILNMKKWRILLLLNDHCHHMKIRLKSKMNWSKFIKRNLKFNKKLNKRFEKNQLSNHKKSKRNQLFNLKLSLQ